MPKIYNYCKINNFPNIELGKEVSTGGQLTIDDVPIRGAHTRVKYLGESENVAFKKYFVVHETLKDFKHREGHDIVETIIAVSEFHMFLHKDNYFMIDTNKKEVRELVARLRDTYPSSLILPRFREIDLIKLHDEIRNDASNNASVSGGFFHNLKINRVSSATIFGQEVGESELWEDFENKGELGGLILNFLYLNSPITAMINKVGGIVVYGNYSEGLALELIDIVNKMIEDFAVEIDGPVSRRRRV
jgi:hypothetical protein